MTLRHKILIGAAGFLLFAFVGFGLFKWVRVLRAMPNSSNCATTLVQISQQSGMVRPFFIGVFMLGLAVFEFGRRGLSRKLRFAYLITLGLGAGFLVAPWIVGLIYQ